MPIWVRIIKDPKPKYISLGVKVKKEHWNMQGNKVKWQKKPVTDNVY